MSQGLLPGLWEEKDDEKKVADQKNDVNDVAGSRKHECEHQGAHDHLLLPRDTVQRDGIDPLIECLRDTLD